MPYLQCATLQCSEILSVHTNATRGVVLPAQLELLSVLYLLKLFYRWILFVNSTLKYEWAWRWAVKLSIKQQTDCKHYETKTSHQQLDKLSRRQHHHPAWVEQQQVSSHCCSFPLHPSKMTFVCGKVFGLNWDQSLNVKNNQYLFHKTKYKNRKKLSVWQINLEILVSLWLTTVTMDGWKTIQKADLQMWLKFKQKGLGMNTFIMIWW